MLLDFDAGQSSLLQYEPLLSGVDVCEWRCTRVGTRWVIAGEPQHETPEMDGLELGSGVQAVLVSSAEAMLALPDS